MLLTRIRLRPLAALCHRLAISTKAGIKDLKFWESESERGSRTHRRIAKQIHEDLTIGFSVGDAIKNSGNYFPMLFRQMVVVGEQSGQGIRIYQRLSDHYERSLRIRREFLSKLLWPGFQLGISICVVGLLIWIMGMIPAAGGKKTDILGFGLVGTKGLIVYLNILIVVGIGILLFVEMSRRGVLWTRTLQRLALKVPILGNSLKTLALARFTWSFQLLLNSGMDLRKCIPFALDASGNDYYARLGPPIVTRIQEGQSLTNSFATTGAFPAELIDGLSVGEESGSLVEVLDRLATDYQDRAGRALATLTQLASYAIWLLITVFIILVIARLYSFYFDAINSAAQGF